MYVIAISIHVFAAALWVGGAFVTSVIDWPIFKNASKDGNFPFHLVLHQGRRIMLIGYIGILGMTSSSIILIILRPPQNISELNLLIIKALALFIIISFTVYGTLFTWPKLQLSLDSEAFKRYRIYVFRAYIMVICGLVSIVLGVIISLMIRGVPY